MARCERLFIQSLPCGAAFGIPVGKPTPNVESPTDVCLVHFWSQHKKGHNFECDKTSRWLQALEFVLSDMKGDKVKLLDNRKGTVHCLDSPEDESVETKRQRKHQTKHQ